MAAAKVQYCDPFKLVDELWDRKIAPSRLKAFSQIKLTEPALPVLTGVRPKFIHPKLKEEPLPDYLRKIKSDILKEISEENSDPIKKEAAVRRRLALIENSDEEDAEDFKTDAGSPLMHDDGVVSPEQALIEEAAKLAHQASVKAGEGTDEIGSPSGQAAPSVKSGGAGRVTKSAVNPTVAGTKKLNKKAAK